jgi:hypothetical protein
MFQSRFIDAPHGASQYIIERESRRHGNRFTASAMRRASR